MSKIYENINRAARYMLLIHGIQKACINNTRDIMYANSSYRKGKVENRIEINKQEYYLLGKM